MMYQRRHYYFKHYKTVTTSVSMSAIFIIMIITIVAIIAKTTVRGNYVLIYRIYHRTV